MRFVVKGLKKKKFERKSKNLEINKNIVFKIWKR